MSIPIYTLLPDGRLKDRRDGRIILATGFPDRSENGSNANEEDPPDAMPPLETKEES